MNKTARKKKNTFFTQIKRMLYLSIVILLILGIGSKYYYDLSLKPLYGTDEYKEVIIEIPNGSNTKDIATILKNEGLIRDTYIFRLVAKIEGKDSLLKSGKYDFNNKMSLKEILNYLVTGGIKKETYVFTIPEGFKINQIINRLSEEGLVDKERFMSLVNNINIFKNEYEFLKEVPKELNLEGYLYPDTYEIYVDATEEEIIRKMLNEFEKNYYSHIEEKAKDLDLSINEVITLASIIEKEAKLDEERKKISAVFHNRLKKGMLLQSCATVQYALGERKERLTYDDLEIDSKYNTYIYKGLPPGPIASPGLKSIIAAVNPEDVNYLYFVANKDGSHTFSVNYRDHQNAKNNN